MAFFTDYHDAFNHAVAESRMLNHAFGIERCKEYSRAGFRVSMIPNNPANRCGWELRCEPVEPPPALACLAYSDDRPCHFVKGECEWCGDAQREGR